jgi:hypothetical protein
MEKPSLLGRAFRAYCKGQIDVMQLQVINRVIDRAFVPHGLRISLGTTQLCIYDDSPDADCCTIFKIYSACRMTLMRHNET